VPQFQAPKDKMRMLKMKSTAKNEKQEKQQPVKPIYFVRISIRKRLHSCG